MLSSHYAKKPPFWMKRLSHLYHQYSILIPQVDYSVLWCKSMESHHRLFLLYCRWYLQWLVDLRGQNEEYILFEAIKRNCSKISKFVLETRPCFSFETTLKEVFNINSIEWEKIWKSTKHNKHFSIYSRPPKIRRGFSLIKVWWSTI